MSEYLAPGVYIEETSYRSAAIEGVSTTTTGFVGAARYGPTSGDPVLVTSLGEFEQTFGDGRPLSFNGTPMTNYLWQGVRAFFEEGGQRLFVARVFRPNSTTDGGLAQTLLPSSAGAGGASAKQVLVQARYPGVLGSLNGQFSLTVTQNILSQVDDPSSTSTPKSKMAAFSGLQDLDVVWISKAPAAAPPAGGGSPPPPPGTSHPPATTGRLYLASRDPTTGAFSFDPGGGGTKIAGSDIDATSREVRIVRLSVSAGVPGGATVQYSGLPLDPGHHSAGGGDSAFALFAPPTPQSDDPTLLISLQIAPGTGGTVPALTGLDVVKALTTNGTPITGLPANNDDTIPLPKRGNVLGTINFSLAGGNDGQLPDLNAYTGSDDPDVTPSGFAALATAEDISIVAAPGHTAKEFDADTRASITLLLIAHAERMRYRIAVLDGPEGAKLTDIRNYRARLDSSYAAIYYPWVTVLDPISNAPLDVPPSGFVAGIYARSDTNYAVYKAPANEPVRLALRFAETINQGRQEILNPEAINCFRYFEGRGNLLWGARIISSNSDWKYVNLRRYFAYLERSIDLGTQFAVFMPNGQRLWDNVRRAVSEFLLNEWQSGALLGDKPEKAYFVRCDLTTMTQNDLDNGRLVCLVGVAPLRPAEFVIFRIGQWTAGSQ